jgi:hypothetical protein
MCVIIDANTSTRIFCPDKDEVDFRYLHDLLFGIQIDKSLNLKVVSGGKLRDELLRLGEVRKMLALLDRAGKTRIVKDELIEIEEQKLISQGLCVSNDIHVVALALADKVRLLCTLDNELITDFKNPAIVNRPRGSIYQNSSHIHLLKEHCKKADDS